MYVYFQDVSTSSVVIMVIANLMVSPTESYVLKHAEVKYKVELIKQNNIIGKVIVYVWIHVYVSH